MTISTITLDIINAKMDVQNIVNEFGKTVQLFLRTDTNVTRDQYNSVIGESLTPKYEFKVMPYQPSPTEKQLEKAGIFEKVDAIAWFAIKDFEDKSIGITDILIDDAITLMYSTVEVDGGTYSIKQKNLSSPYGDSYLYIVLGLSKK